MRDYLLWGRIEHLAPREFVVIVTTVREDDPSDTKSITRVVTSRALAEDMRRTLVIEVGAALVARGDRVIDVETD